MILKGIFKLENFFFLSKMINFIYLNFRVRQTQLKRLDQLWQIPFVRLVKPSDKVILSDIFIRF